MKQGDRGISGGNERGSFLRVYLSPELRVPSEQRPGRNDLSVPQAGAEAAPHGPAVRAEGSVLPPPQPAPKITQWEQPSRSSLKACKSKPRLGQRTGGAAAELPWGLGCPGRGNRPAPPGAGTEPRGPLHSGQLSPPLCALELAGEPRRPPGIPEARG